MDMTTFILIPGAGGDGWYWHRVVPLLEAHGHRAVPVDLPGGDEEAGLAEYAEVIVGAAQNAEDVTLVAQSMGGLSAPLACERTQTRRLILVNAMVPRPGETGGQWWTNTGQGEAMVVKAADEGRDPAADFDPLALFFHDVPDEVREAAFRRGEPEENDRAFADPWPLSAWPDVPTHLVAGSDDRLFPAEFQRRVARERLGLDCTVLPGGHLIALSRPHELAEHLLTSVAERSAPDEANAP
jgi:pimeloyl-ACP methyl ester carboxylesterase